MSTNADGVIFRNDDLEFSDTGSIRRDRGFIRTLIHALSVVIAFSFLTGAFILALALTCYGVEIKGTNLSLLIPAFVTGVLMGLLILWTVTKDVSLDKATHQRKDFSSFAVKLITSTIFFCLPLGVELFISAGYRSIKQVAMPAGVVFLMSIVYLLLVGVVWEDIKPYGILRDSVRASAIAIAIINNISLGALIIGMSTLFARAVTASLI